MKKLDTVLPLIAALIVMISAMWKPETTAGIAVASLIILSIYYSFAGKENESVEKKEIVEPIISSDEK